MPTRLIDKRISQKKIRTAPKRVLVSAFGGQVYTSGSYKVHVFTSTDSFQVFYKASSSIGESPIWEYLVIGGGSSGGGGGTAVYREGGDGGAGGSGSYRQVSTASFNLFNVRTGYTVTVGGGGSASTIATNGSTITSAGATQVGGGSGGNGETLNDPPDPATGGTNGGNGGASVIFSITDATSNPYNSYAAGGGGGGGGGGTDPGQVAELRVFQETEDLPVQLAIRILQIAVTQPRVEVLVTLEKMV